jgi:hypothetical protein
MPSKSRLIIEGDVVTWETEETHGAEDVRITRRRVKREDWLAQVRAQEGHLEFLPPVSVGHIVARQSKGDRSCVVVQLPPSMRSFMYSPDSRLYTVAFPYSILAINFRGQAIDGVSSRNKCGIAWYFRNAPVSSLDDVLGYCNMPNVYSDGYICWGSETIPLDASLGRKVELVVAAIFASNFNSHELAYQWQPATAGVPGHPQSFADWETRSREDPNFILQLAWRPANMTVRQVMERWVGK